MKKFILFSLTIMLCLTSCEIYRFNYDIALDNVERIDKSCEGKCPKVFADKHYEDKNIKATLTIDSLTKGIDVMIANNTSNSIKVNYNDIMFIDTNNQVYRFSCSVNNPPNSIKMNSTGTISITNNMIFGFSSTTFEANLNKTSPYITIPTNSYFNDCFFFSQTNLFPVKFDYTQLDKEREFVRKKYVGSKIKLYIPIDTNGITNEYVFTFKVKKVTIMRYLKTF